MYLIYRTLVVIVTLFISHITIAQEAVVIDSTKKFTVDVVNDSLSHVYYAPRWHEAITNIPAHFADAGRAVASKKVIKPLIIVAGSTAVLYIADQWLVDGVQQLSRNMGLNGQSRYTTWIKINETEVLKVPRNLNTGMVSLGNGFTHALIFTGIAAHGLITNNQKGVRLLTQAVSGYLATQITVRVLKYSFGREMPVNATRNRGNFFPFPSSGNIKNYASLPSGHVATMMFSTTLLAEAYPNSRFIQPVGYSLMAVCAFALMNQGVHWASDYPLAIAIGYLFGKIAANRGRVAIHGSSGKLMDRIEVLPIVLFDGTMGVSLRVDMSPSDMFSR